MEEEKQSFAAKLWNKTKKWIIGAGLFSIATGGAVYAVDKLSQDEHKDKTETPKDPKTEEKDGAGRPIEMVKNEDGSVTYYDPISKRSLGGFKVGHSDKLEKEGDNYERYAAKHDKAELKFKFFKEKTKKEDIQSVDNYEFEEDIVVKGSSFSPKAAVAVRNGKTKEEKNHWKTTEAEDIRVVIEGDTFDFSDAADALRAKSERLQQKKNDTPAPESKVADDKNKEAVLPKQPQLTSVRSKGGRKGGESLGA